LAIQLNEVIPWGRSFEEYRRMFALSDADLSRRILGCGDGPASFNAEATALGHAVVSCDPIYRFPPVQIERRVEECHNGLIAQVRRNSGDFVWDHFHDPDRLGQFRLGTMRRFLADFEAGKVQGRYVTASLPGLPFGDGQFDLALVSHLLFLYSDQLKFDFHLAAVTELLRVAKEVRIFPLLTLERKVSPHVGPLRTELAIKGVVSAVQAAPYEFQVGGNEMLRIGATP
jgi:hypothetical protein